MPKSDFEEEDKSHKANSAHTNATLPAQSFDSSQQDSASGCQPGTFAAGGSVHALERNDPVLDSFTELWGATEPHTWPSSSVPATSPTSSSSVPKKAGLKKPSSVLCDGDLVVRSAAVQRIDRHHYSCSCRLIVRIRT